jgi:hypothetical protein
MIKNIIGKIFKSIPITLTIISCGVAIYAGKVGIEGVNGEPMGYAPSILLGIIIALYFVGIFLDKKESKEESTEEE